MHFARLVLVLSALLAAAPALAQTDADVAHARELFQRGLDAARAEHWVDARDAFAQSLALAERPSTLLNLAGAQVQTGQLIEGAVSYRRFLEIATDARETAHRTQAQAALTALATRTPHISVHVTGLGAGDEVRVDRQVMMPAAIGSATAIDPGAHDISVSRAGHSVASQHVEITEGASLEVTLDATPVVAPATVAIVDTTPPMDQAIAVPVREEAHDDTGLWIGVGVGAGVLVAVGVVLAVFFATQGGSPTPYHGNFGDGVVRF